MPEGDTIYRTARRLRSVLDGKTVQAAESREPSIEASAFLGRAVVSTEARGKHLLVHFDDGNVLHSHMGMTGSWHVYAPQQDWRKPKRQAALVLDVGDSVCVCFSPKLLEFMTTTAMRRHRYLARLGPDLMEDRFSISEAIQRCRIHDPSPLGEIVMNQTVVSGIGNIYKSEVLFLTRHNPFKNGRSLDDEAWKSILSRARELMHSNRSGVPRRTRFGRDGNRLWVYGRLSKPCLKCGEIIRMQRQGDLGRSTYWCPACQT